MHTSVSLAACGWGLFNLRFSGRCLSRGWHVRAQSHAYGGAADHPEFPNVDPMSSNVVGMRTAQAHVRANADGVSAVEPERARGAGTLLPGDASGRAGDRPH